MFKNIVTIILACAALFFYIRYIEKRSLFIPYRAVEETPVSIGLNYEDLPIPVQDGVSINAWWVPMREEAPTIFFLHGNGGNLSHRLGKIAFFHKLGLNVFILDYRGYGKSTGKPSERGLYQDSAAAYDYLRKRLMIPAENIIVYGESLGSAVGIELAGKKAVSALITEGAFTNIADMSRTVYPFLPTFLLGSKFDSLSKIKSLKIPVLMIHSKNDEIVPYRLGRKLYDAFSGQKDFLTIDGGHNESFYNNLNAIEEKIKAFINEK